MNIWENIMNLRKVTAIYNFNEMYLYEIIEDYKEAGSPEEKDEIFRSFCSSIWSCGNKRRIYTKSIRFHIRKDLSATHLGQVFYPWSSIEYKYYKSSTADENWYSIIRQKINNIYTRYFDKEVILGKEYMDLIKTPKRLYYEWISGAETEVLKLTSVIDNAIDDSIKVKKRLQMEKMDLSWEEYKKLTEGFLHTVFQTCMLIGDYEDKTSVSTRLDFLTEDHFYVKYINRSLDGLIRNYQKKYYGVRQHRPLKRCGSCGRMIEIDGRNRQYCESCKKEIRKKTNHSYYIKTVLKS